MVSVEEIEGIRHVEVRLEGQSVLGLLKLVLKSNLLSEGSNELILIRGLQGRAVSSSRAAQRGSEARGSCRRALSCRETSAEVGCGSGQAGEASSLSLAERASSSPP